MRMLLIWLSLMLSIPATAQHDHFFTPFTQREGLSNNSINDIIEDRDGFIWIATDDGLNRFDGHRFEIFRHDAIAPGSPAGNHFTSLCEDQQGRIWCGGYGWKYISCWDPATGAFQNYPLTADGKLHDIYDMYCDANQILWINAATAFFRVDTSTGLVHMCSAEDAPHTRPFSQTSFIGRSFAPATGLTGFWVATKGGVSFYDEEKRAFEHRENSSRFSKLFALKDCRTLITDEAGIVWTNTHFTPETWSWIGYNPMTDSMVFISDNINMDETGLKNNFRHLHLGYDNTLWLGNNARTPLLFNASQLSFDYSLARKYPGCLGNHTLKAGCLDRSGNMWIGTEQGLYVEYAVYRQITIGWIGDYGEFKTPRIKCIYAHSGDEVYLAANKQVWLYRPGSGALEPIPLIVNGTIVDEDTRYISRKSDHEIWVATFFGLYSMDLNTRRCTDEINLLPEHWRKNLRINSYITSVLTTPSGINQILTYNGLYSFDHRSGFYQYDATIEQETGRVYLSNSSPRRDGGRWLVDVHHHQILYTTSDKDSLHTAAFGDELPLSPFAICETPDRRLWVSSLSHGIACYDPQEKKWTTYTTSDGLHSNCVYNLLCDPDGDLVVVSSSGIELLNKNAGRFERIFSEFTLPEYPHREVGIIDMEGKLWAYSQNIFYSFYPKALRMSGQPTGLVFTSILVNGQPQQLQDAQLHDLAYDENNITIRFSALNLNPNAQTRYEYFVYGLSERWLPAGPELFLPALAPGSYEVLIRTDGGTGIFSAEPARLMLKIQPAWYATLWFRLLMLLLVLVITALLIRAWFRRRIKRREEELQRERVVESERLRIARDMHDDLGGGLSSIRLLTEKVRQGSATDAVDEISRLSVELVDNMRQIVWALNSENNSLEETCYYLMNYTRTYLRQAGIQAEISPVIPSSMRISSLQRRNIFLILKESLTNAVRYSGASRIAVEFSLKEGLFTMSVSDNGRGMTRDGSSRIGNGLRNIQRRAEEIQGTVEIRNGEGVRIVLQVPLADNKS